LKFTITYQRCIVDTVEADSIEAAAALAARAVTSLPIEYGAKVLSIFRVDDLPPSAPSIVQAA
jgi:hypothetical protein